MGGNKTEALGAQVSDILQEAAGTGGNSEAISKAGIRIAEIFTAVTADLEKTIENQQVNISSTKKTLTRLRQIIDSELSSIEIFERMGK